MADSGSNGQSDFVQEEWRAVPDFEGLYEVSNLGRVRSLDRIIYKRNVRNGPIIPTRRRGKILRANPDTHGYPTLHLCVGGVDKASLVHHLVLRAFVGERPAGQECRHLDGIRANARLDNLAWGTPLENIQDKFRHGTVRVPRGSEHKLSKLTAVAVRDIRSRASLGEAVGSIAAQYGVSAAHVCRLVSRRAWGWLDDETDGADLVLDPTRM